MDMREWYKNPAIIADQIKTFNLDPKREEMMTGERYYDNRNDICNRQRFYYDVNKQKHIDKTKANNRISHGFLKLQIDEKAGYFLGNPPNITAELPEGSDPNAPNSYQEHLITIFDERFDDTLHDVVVETSSKGVAWLYAYVTTEPPEDRPVLRFELIPAEQIIPIWGDRAKHDLQGVINSYYVTEHDLDTGKDTEVLKVECWHPDGVFFYAEYAGNLVEDIARMYPDMEPDSVPETGLPHFMINGQPYIWQMVPFTPFRNNSRETSDLQQVKGQIDTYDQVVSDNANALEDMRQLLLVLKNYAGTDLSEFYNNLRYWGIIKVDDEGGVDRLELTHSVDMQEKHLDRIKRDIYQLSQSVDMDRDRFGANPSGVALEFMYSGLKLKTDSLERKFKAAFSRLFRLACRFLETTGAGIYDWRLAKVTFQRSQIANVLDQIDAVSKSTMLVSRKTALAHHPWVDDVDQEIEEMDAAEQYTFDRVPRIDPTPDPDQVNDDDDTE